MKKFLLLCFSFGFALNVLAQDRVVTGRVTSKEDGTPLPGVNVLLKGTTNGTGTDTEGKYSLSVPSEGGTLVFTFIGLRTEEIDLGSRTIVDIQMAPDVGQLSEVVVTALNIKQDVKTLSYASQNVTSEKLNLTRANNINDGLVGKIAGVQVRGQAGSKLGSNSDIRIRGVASLTDGNPLYILDGTPVSSIDINPDDIESVNILKGPAATALYGQRGEYGVVQMTSKKAKKGELGINISNSTFIDRVYILPKYQNSYAGGQFGSLQKYTYQPGQPIEWKALDGKFYPDYEDDSSWGPRMVGQEYIPWYAWAPGTKYSGKTARLVPQPNNVRDFYNTAVNSITNVSLGKADDNYSLRASFTKQDQTGITPFTGLSKNTISTQTSVNLNKFITVGANINYVGQKAHGLFDDDYANQTSGSFGSWFHRDLDMKIMRELSLLKSPEGRLISWNHFNPGDGSGANGDLFYRGYYWLNHYAYMQLIDYNSYRNRIFGDFNVTINFSKKIKLFAAAQKNESYSSYENKRPTILKQSFQWDLRPTQDAGYDSYQTGLTHQKEDNLQFLLSYNDHLLDGKLSVMANVGGNDRYEKFSQITANTNLGLVIPDLYTLTNSASAIQYSNFRSQKEVRSMYASGSFGYNETFFLTWSARNDWSSALPKKNNSYFYPSVGGVFIFSELLRDKLPFLSFGKLRANYGQVGSDLGAYQTSFVYGLGQNQWNGNSVSGTPDVQVDPNIKPSLSTNYEVGSDLKFFDGKIGVSASYYKNDRKNQILQVPISNASGFSSRLVNIAEATSAGIEIQLDATPVNSGKLKWDVTFNWAHNTSKVVKLAPGITALDVSAVGGAGYRSTSFSNGTMAKVYHVEGGTWGQIRGRSIKRDSKGNPIVGATGLYEFENNHDYGSVLPQFTGGVQNYITYGPVRLSFNVDFQSGGKYYSQSDMWGSFSGLAARTAGVNENGIPVRTPVADGGGVHVVGVDENGAPVDTHVDAKTYFDQFFNSLIPEQSIFDLTYVKLREVNLTYSIPVKKLGNVSKYFKTASVSLIGRNLWLIYTPNRDFDPSIISNIAGENGQLPGTRSVGFQVKLGF